MLFLRLNVIFAVSDPNGAQVGSGSLKSNLRGNAYVNFIRGLNNLEISEESLIFQVAKEWATAINEQTIPVFVRPSLGGSFVEVATAPAPSSGEGRETVSERVMTAFSRLFSLSRQNNARADAPNPAEPSPAGLNRPYFSPRPIVEWRGWATVASPGRPDRNGLSIVVAGDTDMLRHILEETESRLFWNERLAVEKVISGELQIAAIWDDRNPGRPICGYVNLVATADEHGNPKLMASRIGSRFDHPATPEMIACVGKWVTTVNSLTPSNGDTQEGIDLQTGVRRHLDLISVGYASRQAARFSTQVYTKEGNFRYQDDGGFSPSGGGALLPATSGAFDPGAIAHQWARPCETVLATEEEQQAILPFQSQSAPPSYEDIPPTETPAFLANGLEGTEIRQAHSVPFRKFMGDGRNKTEAEKQALLMMAKGNGIPVAISYAAFGGRAGGAPSEAPLVALEEAIVFLGIHDHGELAILPGGSPEDYLATSRVVSSLYNHLLMNEDLADSVLPDICEAAAYMAKVGQVFGMTPPQEGPQQRGDEPERGNGRPGGGGMSLR
mgnify:FL=1